MNDYVKQLFKYLEDSGYFNVDWIDAAGWVAYLAFMAWVVL